MYSDLLGDRLTARLDGPDLDAVRALTERATNLIDQGLGDGSSATLWLDPFAGDGAQVQPHVDRMIQWSQHVDRMRTRLPLQLSGDVDDPYVDVDFVAVQDDGFVWTWSESYSPAPSASFFATPAGKRVVCVQLHLNNATAISVRSASAGNWIECALDAGYAAGIASSRAYSDSAVPYARPFFEALRQGWTLAEAWYLALPYLREGLYLVGDPLLHVALPQRGWDVFGPLGRLESLAADAPSYALREGTRELSLPASLQPGGGEVGTYVMRHVDAEGRREASLASIRVMNSGGAAVMLPLAPVWPGHAVWPVHVEDAQLVLTVLWDRPLSTCRVETIELLGEVDGAAEMVLAEPAFDPRGSQVQVVLALPTEQGRYRWRIISADGVAVETAWSREVRPQSASGGSLQLLEND